MLEGIMIRLLLYTFAMILLCTQTLFAQFVWQQEFHDRVDGVLRPMYDGGWEYAKPELVDIDDDGDLDLFVGTRNQSVVFYLNEGSTAIPAWNLVNHGLFDVGDVYTSPTFVDIDNDGDLDAFIGSWSGQIAFYRNDGDAQWPQWTLVSLTYESIDAGANINPVFADIDNDGDQDLFIGNDSGKIYHYENTGTAESPTFVLASDTYGGFNFGLACRPRFVDIDNDGDLDLLPGVGFQIWFQENTGTAESAIWTFRGLKYANLTTQGYCAPDFKDIDNDDDLDLIFGEAFQGMGWLENIGTAASATWATGEENMVSLDFGYPNAMAVTDLDDDGDQDIVTSGFNSGRGLVPILNQGTASQPNWSLQTPVDATMSGAPAFCDIDNDGDQDLFVGRGNGSITYFQNNGTASSPVWVAGLDNYNAIDVGDTYCVPTFGDLDGDGDFDLLCGRSDGKLVFIENTGSAASAVWGANQNDYAGIDLIGRSQPDLFDYDSDGDLDLFVGDKNGGLGYWENTGNATNATFALVTSQFQNWSFIDDVHPVMADMDADTDPDMLVGASMGGFLFFRNMGATADRYFNPVVSSSPQSATVVIPATVVPQILGFDIQDDDEVGVFDQEGNCYGSGIWTGNTLYITVYGDDPGTTEIDGFTNGEEIAFRLWDHFGDVEYYAAVSYVSGTGGFQSDNTFIVDDLHSLEPVPVELALFTAVAIKEGVELTWVTVTETNNYGFAIQRFAEEQWAEIGFVRGAGTTIETQRYRFIDKNGENGDRYRLKQIDSDGMVQYSPQVTVSNSIPLAYELMQNFPNPFNPTSKIRFVVPETEHVSLILYDLLGRQVKVLLDRQMEPGEHVVKIDATELAAGAYFYRMKSGSFKAVKRAMVLK